MVLVPSHTADVVPGGGLVATGAVEQKFFTMELGLKRRAVALLQPGVHTA